MGASGFAVFLAAYGLSRFRPGDPLPGFPRIVLWAWERPEDLRFLSPQSAGVAYLDRTISITGDSVAAKPRVQPLQITPGTAVMAVVRIEASAEASGSAESAVREILPAANQKGVRAIQIDFDARKSQRSWYRSLLRALRFAMPREIPLVMTALESWCDGDPWIRNMPVADATPMLFQMGAGERIPSDFSLALCRSSVGLGMNELPSNIPHGRRLFFFQSRAWTRDAYYLAVSRAGEW